MPIRLATYDDLPDLHRVFDTAKSAMRASGNTVQWINGYPSDELLRSDIDASQLYVLEGEQGIYAAFALIFGEDPAYGHIEDGAWLNDEPYATIHRVASDGTTKGVMRRIVEFCETKGVDLRIDTHESNAAMRAAVEKTGFIRCGIVFMADGTERIAYQRRAV